MIVIIATPKLCNRAHPPIVTIKSSAADISNTSVTSAFVIWASGFSRFGRQSSYPSRTVVASIPRESLDSSTVERDIRDTAVAQVHAEQIAVGPRRESRRNVAVDTLDNADTGRALSRRVIRWTSLEASTLDLESAGPMRAWRNWETLRL